jgi:hypothetical protein
MAQPHFLVHHQAPAESILMVVVLEHLREVALVALVGQVVLQMVWGIAQISTHQFKDLMHHHCLVLVQEQGVQTDQT